MRVADFRHSLPFESGTNRVCAGLSCHQQRGTTSCPSGNTWCPLSRSGPVDINTASAEALAEAIHGVGLKRARAIVLHREEHGAFESVDQLAQVQGIGTKTIERNRDRLTTGASE